MNLALWLFELGMGMFLLARGIPYVLAFARSIHQLKSDTHLPRFDTVEYPAFSGRVIGIILGVTLSVLLHTTFRVNTVLLAALFSSLALYVEEWLTQQPLPEKHPWRVVVEDMAARMGIDPGEVCYRQCAQSAPYARSGGITLPSKALRGMNEAALRFVLAGALTARQRGSEWSKLIRWLLTGMAAYSVCIVGPILERPQEFFSYDRALPYQVISAVLLVFWARKVPAYVRAADTFALDCEALKHTGDFAAASDAIHKTDTPQSALKRVWQLKEWWDTYQQEQAALKAGTPGALQSSNTQATQTVGKGSEMREQRSA